MIKKFKELYAYRQFLLTTVRKDFRGKYKKSFLGVLWSFINPLLQLFVYALVFPFIMRVQEENYIMFLFVALVPWNFFITSVTQCTNSIIVNSGIIKKVYFPREILPISIVTSGVINFLISCIIIAAALIISGIGFSPCIALLPLILIIQYIVTLAIGFVLSAITVYLRDLEYLINLLLMLWMYLTPVLYPITIIPENFRKYFYINPMTQVISAYRDILYYQKMPDMQGLMLLFGISLVLIVPCYMLFKKLEKRFAEEL